MRGGAQHLVKLTLQRRVPVAVDAETTAGGSPRPPGPSRPLGTTGILPPKASSARLRARVSWGRGVGDAILSPSKGACRPGKAGTGRGKRRPYQTDDPPPLPAWEGGANAQPHLNRAGDSSAAGTGPGQSLPSSTDAPSSPSASPDLAE